MKLNAAGFGIIILVVIGIGVTIWGSSGASERGLEAQNSDNTLVPVPTVGETQPGNDLVEPIDGFRQRITRKHFGTYVTPQNSPISPEKFTGYHTGVDVEYEDVDGDVVVSAVADGEVVVSRVVSGYGGVVVIRHEIGSRTLYGLYGHLRPDSMIDVEENVERGENIGVLGTGYSEETDGERKHLHFSVSSNDTMAGYVATQGELDEWVDPLSLY